VTTTVGGSLAAAKCLMDRSYLYAIHWNGGRHHARAQQPSGFCFVNDVVLCCMRLQEVFGRVLCVDVDVHHGDGTAEAFEYDNSVFCLSLHQYGAGLFPGTGGLEEAGSGPGKHYTVNVPLVEGTTDAEYLKLFHLSFLSAVSVFDPGVVVVVLGTDVLQGDPLGCLNISVRCMERCLTTVRDLGLPTLLLGAGGYDDTMCARCLATVTGVFSRVTLPADIPSDDEYFTEYGPDYSRYTPGRKTYPNATNPLSEMTASIVHRMKALDAMLWEPRRAGMIDMGVYKEGSPLRVRVGSYLSWLSHEENIMEDDLVVVCSPTLAMEAGVQGTHVIEIPEFIDSVESGLSIAEQIKALLRDGQTVQKITFLCITGRVSSVIGALLALCLLRWGPWVNEGTDELLRRVREKIDDFEMDLLWERVLNSLLRKRDRPED